MPARFGMRPARLLTPWIGQTGSGRGSPDVSGSIAPHEPKEEVLSTEDAFRDAAESEARWQAFEEEKQSRQRREHFVVSRKGCAADFEESLSS